MIVKPNWRVTCLLSLASKSAPSKAVLHCPLVSSFVTPTSIMASKLSSGFTVISNAEELSTSLNINYNNEVDCCSLIYIPSWSWSNICSIVVQYWYNINVISWTNIDPIYVRSWSNIGLTMAKYCSNICSIQVQYWYNICSIMAQYWHIYLDLIITLYWSNPGMILIPVYSKLDLAQILNWSWPNLGLNRLDHGPLLPQSRLDLGPILIQSRLDPGPITARSWPNIYQI